MAGKIMLILGILIGLSLSFLYSLPTEDPKKVVKKDKYWFILHRKSNIELLYKGIPGEEAKSRLVRTFHVKAGVPGQKPTPLPKLLGKKYWLITKKFETTDNFETAPYFLEFNVPAPDVPPYGPSPYMECAGQCNWEIAGPFGLHGVNGDLTRLDSTNIGSSGCVRHTDEDISYLYNLLDPEKEQIRYYIKNI